MSNIPTVTFNNGNDYPILGLGTWKVIRHDVLRENGVCFELNFNVISGNVTSHIVVISADDTST